MVEVPPRTTDALRAEGLEVAYGTVVALHDVTLHLSPGSLVAVTGPSGAGKTSMLWALAGAVAPSQGEVRFGDRLVAERERAAGLGIALVPQGNGLADMLTATENITAALLALGVSAVDARRRASEALTAVGLVDSGDHLIEELSGGQQQRVAVARGLAARSTVLLADEPTSDLDSGNRERVVALLRAEADAGAVVLMATHDPESAAEADAEIVLDQGVMTWKRVAEERTSGEA
ncbi:ABC transporter ATP-binding protein [Segeticoccus rhizosphaerae]|uniref:ABC transporter ATP-binding protein n=1 Tax=Segeticoccus rhizosphaerae TaxID=1104777 RepID=UPI0010BFDA6D|nr:ATP-binding cassette domain-containing protein [Ornithinicoccus soli]